jgi:alpha-L-fucosidase
LWFDGEWDPTWTHEQGLSLYQYIKELQPNIIINNRVDKGREGMDGTNKGAEYTGDYDTPEQKIGKFNTDRPWETCMTICQQWAWKPNDHLKSLKECIDTLVRVVGGDGNFLLNVGPMPNGQIEPIQVERLREIGDWLGRYGQSVYKTRGGPFKPGTWGASTHKNNTIYIHILNRTDDTITLPPIPKKIIGNSVLTGGLATVNQSEQGIEISLPQSDRQKLDMIITLQLDGPASEIMPRDVSSNSLTARKKAEASNVYQNMREFGPDKAVDDDSSTRWATDYGVKEGWLEVDLGKPSTFNCAKISEEYDRVQEFELQYKLGNQWWTFARGMKIGPDCSMQFDSVTARYIRLNILKATEGPTIWEFQLYVLKR